MLNDVKRVQSRYRLYVFLITAILCGAAAGMLTLISWRSCRVGSSEKALNFLGSVTLEKRRESYVRNPVEKCSSNY